MKIRITNDMVHFSYEVAKDSYEGKMDKQSASEIIQRETGMSKRSANDFVGIFHCMMTGNEYKGTTLNTYATKYYLQQIKKDFGEPVFRSAIQSAQKHLEYYHSVGYSRPSIAQLLLELK